MIAQSRRRRGAAILARAKQRAALRIGAWEVMGGWRGLKLGWVQWCARITAMAEAKTKKTPASVGEFLALVEGAERRADAQAVCALMREVTGAEPVMWGASIVGFGEYRYIYGSGREGQWPAVGFSPRKAALTVYLAEGLAVHGDLLGRLGKHSIGKGCLYIKKLSDVDVNVLRELVGQGFTQVNGKTIRS